MVVSRALGLAAVALVIGYCAIGPVAAQENLDAGKSPSQLFAGTCTACHKSARGLLKTVAPGSLQGFLRQHYTTGPEMAGVLASYLMSNGAADTRYGEKPKGAKEGRESKPRAKPEARSEARPEAAQPAAEGQEPASEHKPKRRASKRAKPAVQGEPPKPGEQSAEPARSSATSEPARNETAKVEPASSSPKPAERTTPAERARPAETPASAATAEAAKPKVNEALPPSLRPDPVPPVTPAPAAAASAASPSITASAPPPASAESANSPLPPISH